MKCEYFTPLAYILHVCTIYNPILVKCLHVTTLHLGVPLMGRQQIEAPWTFHMALAYFCDINSLLCNKVCVQVNMLSATYCLLPSMVFHSTIKCSKYVSSRIFALFLGHLEKYNYNRHSTTEYDNIAYNCSSNMPTNDNHSKTVIYNYF